MATITPEDPETYREKMRKARGLLAWLFPTAMIILAAAYVIGNGLVDVSGIPVLENFAPSGGTGGHSE